jgi:8-oxo-dGTP diphosphatase
MSTSTAATAAERPDPERPATPQGATAPRQILLVAAVALIDPDGRVLLAERPPGKHLAGTWEFPGGKVQPGETPEAALIRELDEELGIDVVASCLAPFTFASHSYAEFHLLMPLYVCRKWQGIVTAREGQRLKWVRPAQFADYPMPPADKPLVAMLRDLL